MATYRFQFARLEAAQRAKGISVLIYCKISLKTKTTLIILPASTIRQARDVGYLLNTITRKTIWGSSLYQSK